MSLPDGYTTPEEYFRDCLEFLHSYAWIFQHSNTCFIKERVLDHFHADMAEYFCTIDTEALNRFPRIFEPTPKDSLPDSLHEFCGRLRKLTPPQAFHEPTFTEDGPTKGHFRRVNVKKQHEITRLAQVIRETCSSCEVLADFGSGLGYLSEQLYTNSGDKLLLLGLESDAYRVEAARRRRDENTPSAKSMLRFEEAYVTEESAQFIQDQIDSLSLVNGGTASPEAAIIGLHACADLTVTSMRLFLRMPNVRRLVIMPCCYHKMELDGDRQNTFRNFPLSEAFRQVASAFEGSADILNRPFLRLACQQTAARWYTQTREEHERHGSAMLQRALAEAIKGEDETVSKAKGQRGPAAADPYDALCQQYGLKSKHNGREIPWNSQHSQRFQRILDNYPHRRAVQLSEALTCLQTSIQKLCENLVLYDRICFMKEYGRSQAMPLTARFEKILNEKLSPRCQALIAEKL